MPLAIGLLRSASSLLHTRAAATVALIAQSEHCAKMIIGGGGVKPLITLARYGGDEARRNALAALQLIALEKYAHSTILREGGKDLLDGIRSHGAANMRDTAKALQVGVCACAVLRACCLACVAFAVHAVSCMCRFACAVVFCMQASLEGGGGASVAVDSRGRAKLARQTRLQQSKLWTAQGLQGRGVRGVGHHAT